MWIYSFEDLLWNKAFDFLLKIIHKLELYWILTKKYDFKDYFIRILKIFWGFNKLRMLMLILSDNKQMNIYFIN